jgi:RimJ/RimL family protein N-acetyltransferase
MIETITLENARARLSPLTLESADKLGEIASQKGLVAYSPTDIETPEKLLVFVREAIYQHQHKLAIPFIVFDKQAGKYAGCTRYMNIDWKNKVLHIGSTWIGREYQGSGLNLHMKYLMLEHAFEKMGFEKVEFRIDERNARSRRAVEKLGAVLEGVLRKNVYLMDGFKRNTCCYGILLEEWHTLKPLLSGKL